MNLRIGNDKLSLFAALLAELLAETMTAGEETDLTR